MPTMTATPDEVDHSSTAARSRLDDAVREYVASAMVDGRVPDGRITVGWVIGIGLTGLCGEGEEEDGLVWENAPAMNAYLARGIADTVAEAYAARTAPGE